MSDRLRLILAVLPISLFAVFLMVILTAPGLSAFAKFIWIMALLLPALLMFAFFVDGMILPPVFVRWLLAKQNRRKDD